MLKFFAERRMNMIDLCGVTITGNLIINGLWLTALIVVIGTVWLSTTAIIKYEDRLKAKGEKQ